MKKTVLSMILCLCLFFAAGAGAFAEEEEEIWDFVDEEECDLVLPESLKEIGEEAFRGLDVEAVYLQDGVEKIGALAFADCEYLFIIRIPGTVREIAPDAFQNCAEDLAIYGEDGSYASDYAEQHDLIFIYEEDDDAYTPEV